MELLLLALVLLFGCEFGLRCGLYVGFRRKLATAAPDIPPESHFFWGVFAKLIMFGVIHGICGLDSTAALFLAHFANVATSVIELIDGRKLPSLLAQHRLIKKNPVLFAQCQPLATRLGMRLADPLLVDAFACLNAEGREAARDKTDLARLIELKKRYDEITTNVRYFAAADAAAVTDAPPLSDSMPALE